MDHARKYASQRSAWEYVAQSPATHTRDACHWMAGACAAVARACASCCVCVMQKKGCRARGSRVRAQGSRERGRGRGRAVLPSQGWTPQTLASSCGRGATSSSRWFSNQRTSVFHCNGTNLVLTHTVIFVPTACRLVCTKLIWFSSKLVQIHVLVRCAQTQFIFFIQSIFCTKAASSKVNYFLFKRIIFSPYLRRLGN